MGNDSKAHKKNPVNEISPPGLAGASSQNFLSPEGRDRRLSTTSILTSISDTDPDRDSDEEVFTIISKSPFRHVELAKRLEGDEEEEARRDYKEKFEAVLQREMTEKKKDPAYNAAHDSRSASNIRRFFMLRIPERTEENQEGVHQSQQVKERLKLS